MQPRRRTNLNELCHMIVTVELAHLEHKRPGGQRQAATGIPGTVGAAARVRDSEGTVPLASFGGLRKPICPQPTLKELDEGNIERPLCEVCLQDG